METMKNISSKICVLLPMKAHSERVKEKNFRLFNGKPLFQWVLETILSLNEVAEIIINTDATDILTKEDIINSDRIRLRKRKHELCGDFVSMNKIIEDDINNSKADIYLMTHTTNPLIRSSTIKNALNQFQNQYMKNNADSLFTVNRFQTRFYRKDGSPVNHDPTHLLRTQDLEPWYEENSNLYIFTEKSFKKTNARIGEKPIMSEMPPWESIDIDNQESWDFAEMISKSIYNSQQV